jgi:very-short-patch-repair endonuclease
MKFIHSNNNFKPRRSELRNNATLQEKILWSYLRKNRLKYKFRRQHSIGPYIVDFYCPEKRLVIEIDGSQHNENQEYDRERTLHLENLGHRVLRFWNNEINTNIIAVIEMIATTLSTTPSAQADTPPNLGGEEYE